MTVNTDPRYRALATRSAARMGTTSAAIINAMLAQWSCELGANDVYPPRRNNPGNLAAGAASSIGASYTVETPNPQPGNPIVTFATPEVGANAYGNLLQRLPRYAGVRQAVADHNGPEFLREISRAHYGTSLACMESAYVAPPKPSKPPVLTSLWGKDVPADIRAVDPKTPLHPAGWHVGQAIKRTGHYFGGLINMLDIKLALDRIGHNYGSVINPTDVEYLVAHA